MSEVLARVRRVKTEAKLSQRAGVARVIVRAPAEARRGVEAAAADLRDALTIAELVLDDGTELEVEIDVV